MKRNIFLFVLFCLFAQWSMAQTPKWLDKSRRAVFSVITYDSEDKIQSVGNGFFISEDGMALSDYSLFKGAQRAVAVDFEGKQMPIVAIQGANSMYDIIKFKVGISGKKVISLPVASTAAAVDATVYLLPYSTQKATSFTTGKVKEASLVGESDYYYSLAMKLDDKMVSCPVVNTAGQLVGLVQKSSDKDADQVCYAVGASLGKSLEITALSANDYTLNSVGIKKGMPETEQQALVYLYMSSSAMSPEDYSTLLDDYLIQYPRSADGYMRRANHYIYLSVDDASMDKVVADIEKALSVSDKKDDVHFQFAKLIYNYQLSGPEKVYSDWTYDKALSEVRAAISIDPLSIYIQLEGDINFAKQDYEAAFTAYYKLTQTELVSPAIFFSAAKAKELANGDLEEIVALMDSCIAYCSTPMTSDNAAFLLERARIYMAAEKYRPAMLDYDAYYNAVKGSVNDVFYFYREQACFHAKQFQRALDDINKAIELNPAESTYYAELAVVNIRVGRNEDAVDALNRAIEIDPQYAEAYRLLGLAQTQMKKQSEACASFAKAKELGDPNVDNLIEKHCK